MFNHIRVKNYQSLKDISLDLSKFTVIVGATDSGKSAFFRAISTLISNKRGADFIRHGERICSIEADLDQGKLKLQRGKGTSDNFYEIEIDGVPEKYTKLGGGVPEEVSAFLRIEAKDPVNVASQFDKPYLLDNKEYGPSETARILGALTNVNIIFEGAREAKRQKTSASTTLRTRGEDLESAEAQLASYDTLDSLISQVENLELIIADTKKADSAKTVLEELTVKIESCDKLIETLQSEMTMEVPDITEIEKSIAVVSKLRTLISTVASATTVIQDSGKLVTIELPDIADIESMTQAKNKIETLLSNYQDNLTTSATSKALIVECDEQLEKLDAEYKETLRKAGTCPTCGQTTH